MFLLVVVAAALRLPLTVGLHVAQDPPAQLSYADARIAAANKRSKMNACVLMIPATAKCQHEEYAAKYRSWTLIPTARTAISCRSAGNRMDMKCMFEFGVVRVKFETDESASQLLAQGHEKVPWYRSVSGPCSASDDCVLSPHYPAEYGEHEACTIVVNDDAKVYIGSTDFETEFHYDILQVNTKVIYGGSLIAYKASTYSGRFGPTAIATTDIGNITWTSDNRVTGGGWKLCEVEAPPGPTQSSLKKEATVGTTELSLSAHGLKTKDGGLNLAVGDSLVILGGGNYEAVTVGRGNLDGESVTIQLQAPMVHTYPPGSVVTLTDAPSCFDVHGLAKDKMGETCAVWQGDMALEMQRKYPDWCAKLSGFYDDNDFTARDMCCGCGGGLQVQEVTTTPTPTTTQILAQEEQRAREEAEQAAAAAQAMAEWPQLEAKAEAMAKAGKAATAPDKAKAAAKAPAAPAAPEPAAAEAPAEATPALAEEAKPAEERSTPAPGAKPVEATPTEAPRPAEESKPAEVAQAPAEAPQEGSDTQMLELRASVSGAPGVLGEENFGEDPALELTTDLAAQAAVEQLREPSGLPPDRRGLALGGRQPAGPAKKLWPKQEARLLAQSSRFWLFGAHHKAGTVLMRQLAARQTELLGMPPCVDDGCRGDSNRCTIKKSFFSEQPTRTYFACSVEDKMISSLRRLAATSGGTFRGVHVIRDPLALVVSGYLYHLHSADHLPDPAMRNMSLEDGIAVEAEFALRVTLREMVSAYETSLSENGTSYNDVMTVRLEDLMRSSEDYDRVASAVWNHMVGDMAGPYLLKRLQAQAGRSDLNRNPLRQKEEKVEGDFLFGHVAEEGMKLKAAEALKRIPGTLMEQLLQVRRRLGYS